MKGITILTLVLQTLGFLAIGRNFGGCLVWALQPPLPPKRGVAGNQQSRSNSNPFSPRSEANQPSTSSSSSRNAATANTSLSKSLATFYRTGPPAKTSEPSEAPPPPPSAPPSPPETTPRAQATPPSTESTSSKGPVTVAESIEDLLALLDGSSGDVADNTDPSELTMVLFHAHYCKICQRATMQLPRAAKEYPSVRIAKVESRVIPKPVGDNLRSLGVTKFPFVQIYRGGDCVASFSTGPTHMFMRKVRDTLDLCLARDEEAWAAFARDFGREIAENREARHRLGIDTSGLAP